MYKKDDERMTVTTPPMGWNSWNTFGKDINEELILKTAEFIAESGLKGCGYDYVVIDDCWAEKERDENGNLRADQEKFPNGIKYIADKIHSMGLKLGIYSCAGPLTCAGYPGSYEREFKDAALFASWDVDFLKYDYCYHSEIMHGKLLFRRMGAALASSGRDILFSACTGGLDETAQWIKSANAQMWRSTPDIMDNWSSVKSIIYAQEQYLSTNGNGCFNDMDMLIVGMNGKGNVGLGGCNYEEYKTHFTAWAFFGSPLFIGCDILNMDEKAKKILTNKDVIAVNQDKAYLQPYRIGIKRMNNDERLIFVRQLEKGDFAILILNMSDEKQFMCFMPDELGLSLCCHKTLKLKDLWTKEEHIMKNEIYKTMLDPHGCQLLRAMITDI